MVSAEFLVQAKVLGQAEEMEMVLAYLWEDSSLYTSFRKVPGN
jgi:hypothetical protein